MTHVKINHSQGYPQNLGGDKIHAQFESKETGFFQPISLLSTS